MDRLVIIIEYPGDTLYYTADVNNEEQVKRIIEGAKKYLDIAEERLTSFDKT
jgi:hypothetical protein